LYPSSIGNRSYTSSGARRWAKAPNGTSPFELLARAQLPEERRSALHRKPKAKPGPTRSSLPSHLLETGAVRPTLPLRIEYLQLQLQVCAATSCTSHKALLQLPRTAPPCRNLQPSSQSVLYVVRSSVNPILNVTLPYLALPLPSPIPSLALRWRSDLLSIRPSVHPPILYDAPSRPPLVPRLADC
jgi:hypothetical protein